MLIQRIYHVDPLVRPKCGGMMKIVGFVEAGQDEVIRNILEHCGLWRPLPSPPPRAPPPAAPKPVHSRSPSDSTSSVEMDPDYLEHRHREKQAELPLDV